MKRTIYLSLMLMCFASCKTFVINSTTHRVPVAIDSSGMVTIKNPVEIKGPIEVHVNNSTSSSQPPPVKCQRMIPFFYYINGQEHKSISGTGFITGYLGDATFRINGMPVQGIGSQVMIAITNGAVIDVSFDGNGKDAVWGYYLEN